jgi:hypothetical protein
MRGDATLFTRDDEVEAQWRIIDPILERWDKGDAPVQVRRGLPRADEADGILEPGHAGGRSRWPGPRAHADAAASGRRRTARRRRSRTALRHLLEEEHARTGVRARARPEPGRGDRREWRGEILNRLERVGRYHASRTILCVVDRRRRRSRRPP